MSRNRDDYAELATIDKARLLDVFTKNEPDGAFYLMADEIGLDWGEVKQLMRMEGEYD